MLFNSYGFIFIFLPLTLLVFFLIGHRNHHRIAVSWLVMCSLFFYGWWYPANVFLILFSMLFNYAFGVMLGSDGNGASRKLLLVFGVAVNLSLLGYFKYANFFVDQINLVFGLDYNLEKILLPLAISFFTFQQIAYLVDAYRHETREYNFLHYCLFVTFFPQLIAGPIVHHKEMLPQFAQNTIYRFNYRHISVGIGIFLVGLFKKVVIADGVAAFGTPVFNAVDTGNAVTFFEAWEGALAYTLQLYFDFSGYSDMAIGLAYMFGIKLPLNFNSPYKARSIIDFWRRWHMTLSRFLRDYLYFALGGSYKGQIRRYVNVFLTMLLGGIWHGAGWTFVIWGMLHGVYLIVNHGWRKVRADYLHWSEHVGTLEIVASKFLTLFAVVIGWVYFRAETMSGANQMVITMLGFNGISLAPLMEIGFSFGGMFGGTKANFGEGEIWIGILLFMVLILPNTQELIDRDKPSEQLLIFKRPIVTALTGGTIFYFIFVNLMEEAEFLYFNF